MPKPAESMQIARARQLTGELRTLQDRMNRTIEQLCALVGGHSFELESVLGGSEAAPSFSPAWLQMPVAQPVHAQAINGEVLGEGSVFYTDGRSSMFQILQLPLARHADSSFSMSFNMAEFDGSWMSVVFDMRALLAGQPTGRARINIAVEVNGTALTALTSRVSWSGDHAKGDRHFDLHTNQVCTAQADIDYFDPSLTQAFDFHLILQPPARASLELRRLRVSLTMEPPALVVPAQASVFEATP
jgi:hypothetical protein